MLTGRTLYCGVSDIRIINQTLRSEVEPLVASPVASQQIVEPFE